MTSLERVWFWAWMCAAFTLPIVFIAVKGI